MQRRRSRWDNACVSPNLWVILQSVIAFHVSGESETGEKMAVRRAKWLACAVACVSIWGVSAANTRAADILWNTQDGNWSLAGNWNPAAVPGSGDNALVNFVGTGNPTAHVTTDVGTVAKVSVSNNNNVSIETGGVLTANGGSDG